MPDFPSSESGSPSGRSVAAVLDRTTPRDLAPLDLHDLARRGRRRRQRHRATVGGALVAVLALLAVGVARPWSQDHRPDVGTAVPGPDGEPLVAPVGSWSAIADPPFPSRLNAFGGTLSDGRVLVWGGEVQEGENWIPQIDGAIYDPGSDTWTDVPELPLPSVADGVASFAVALAGDRLAVAADDVNDDVVVAAVYDPAEQRWTSAPRPEQLGGQFEGLAWDGDTLALVRTEPGVDPVTVRWQPGDDGWEVGAAPPLSSRTGVTAAFDGAELALWGGTPAGGSTGPDGAIYDLAADDWRAMSSSPLSTREQAAMTWSHGRLVVGGGQTRDRPDDFLTDLAVYDPSTDTWARLAGPPDGSDALLWTSLARTSGQPNNDFVAGQPNFMLADAGEPQSGTIPRWFLDGDTWELAPDYAVTMVGDLVVAFTGGFSIGLDAPFVVDVRSGPDEWVAAADAPFLDLQYATVVATGDQLLVIGGLEPDHQTPGRAWSLDLSD
jgi:hypothetical protein